MRNPTGLPNVHPTVTEEQNYTVIQTHKGIERRHYPPCVVADVTITAAADKAGNMAFRPLVSYISGANRSSRKLAMTAPVLQEPKGEKLAMTAPVLQESAGDDTWVVSFVLPRVGNLTDYPEPTNPAVTLRELPAHDAAAVRYSGRWTTGNVEKHTAALLQAIDDAGWTATGSPRWARYDPPWKPAFARRNEVIVPLAAEAAAAEEAPDVSTD